MKAVVKTVKGPGNVFYADVPEPGRPGSGQLLVEVRTAGICGSDIHIWHGTFMNNPPVILGHEYVGVVLEVGEGVSGFKTGDLVSSEVPTECCGKCRYCRTGDIQHCISRKGMGATRNGAFAKYALIDERVTHAIPESVGERLGALIEPVSTCAHCMERTRVEGGEVVVVAGPGPIGLIMCQLAKAEGGFVVVTGTDADEARLRLALEVGADRVINVQREDGVRSLREMTDGYGPDVYIECSGSARSVEMGIEALRPMGRYTQMGVLGASATVNWDRLANKEIVLTGVKCEKYSSWERALQYVTSGKVDLAKMVTHEFGFDQWEEAFRLFEGKAGLKILMHPVE
ncbi:MAG: alcohol dehydrogenase catalytic domain-containing protein [Clostridiales bacterium]|nr:alcohol dehydrogenase catalytic domain-containing protein [Clostridiales bacterium]